MQGMIKKEPCENWKLVALQALHDMLSFVETEEEAFVGCPKF